MPKEGKTVSKTILFTGLMFLVAAGGLLEFRHLRAVENLAESTVSGSRAVTVIRVRISGQRLDYTCSDPVVMRYLSDCLARPRIAVNGGIAYDFEITISDGSTFRAAALITPDGDRLTLRLPDGEDFGYGIDLIKPEPVEVAELLHRLGTRSGAD